MSDKEIKICFIIFCSFLIMIPAGLLFVITEWSVFYGGISMTLGFFGIWTTGNYVSIRRHERND